MFSCGSGAPDIADVTVELPGSMLHLWRWSCWLGCWSYLCCSCDRGACGWGVGAPYIADAAVELLSEVLKHPMLRQGAAGVQLLWAGKRDETNTGYWQQQCCVCTRRGDYVRCACTNLKRERCLSRQNQSPSYFFKGELHSSVFFVRRRKAAYAYLPETEKANRYVERK